jgi:transposase
MYRKRAKILFELYTTIEKANNLAQELSYIFENNKHKDVDRLKLAHCYDKGPSPPKEESDSIL